jgi:hypothetical protein
MQMFAYRNTERGIRMRHVQQIVEQPFKRPVLLHVVEEDPVAIAERARLAAIENERLEGMRMLRRNGMPEWAISIASEVSDRHAIPLSDIAGRKRFQGIVDARKEAAYLIKAKHPMLSMVLLGKWFARDHTSVTHLVACHAAAHNLPKLVGYDLEKVRNRDKVRKAAGAAP